MTGNSQWPVNQTSLGAQHDTQMCPTPRLYMAPTLLWSVNGIADWQWTDFFSIRPPLRSGRRRKKLQYVNRRQTHWRLTPILSIPLRCTFRSSAAHSAVPLLAVMTGWRRKFRGFRLYLGDLCLIDATAGGKEFEWAMHSISRRAQPLTTTTLPVGDGYM